MVNCFLNRRRMNIFYYLKFLIEMIVLEVLELINLSNLTLKDFYKAQFFYSFKTRYTRCTYCFSTISSLKSSSRVPLFSRVLKRFVPFFPTISGVRIRLISSTSPCSSNMLFRTPPLSETTSSKPYLSFAISSACLMFTRSAPVRMKS